MHSNDTILDVVSTKQCQRCKKTKPATNEYFSRDKARRDGFQFICKVCNSEYRAANMTHKVEYTRKYRADHPEQARESARKNERNRRARKLESQGTYTDADVDLQYKRQKGRCYYCKVKVGKTYHIDHVVPLSRGGANDPSNLVVACTTCNLSKQNRLPHEWARGGRLL